MSSAAGVRARIQGMPREAYSAGGMKVSGLRPGELSGAQGWAPASPTLPTACAYRPERCNSIGPMFASNNVLVVSQVAQSTRKLRARHPEWPRVGVYSMLHAEYLCVNVERAAGIRPGSAYLPYTKPFREPGIHPPGTSKVRDARRHDDEYAANEQRWALDEREAATSRGVHYGTVHTSARATAPARSAAFWQPGQRGGGIRLSAPAAARLVADSSGVLTRRWAEVFPGSSDTTMRANHGGTSQRWSCSRDECPANEARTNAGNAAGVRRKARDKGGWGRS
ncbi:hypothetical protein VTO73DRAFT_280 [Trametes versicolor]